MTMNKYKIQRTTKFKKSYKKLITKQGYDEKEFKKVVEMLINDTILPEKYHNHLLEPKKNGIWECHIKPDWLLVYMKDKNTLILLLVDTGSHSDLFK